MKTIKLKSKGIGRYDDVSPFLLESGELELHVTLPKASGELFLVAELNGKALGALPIAKDGTVSLGGLSAGELHAEIKHYLRGELVEAYKVEPLLLKSVDTSLAAMPEIAALTAECEALRSRSDELAHELTGQKEETKRELNRLCCAFLSFAYAEYKNDVQLNSKELSAEEFAKVLGYAETKISEELYEKI